MTDTRSPFGTHSLQGVNKLLYNLCRRLGTGWLNLRLAFIIRKGIIVNLSVPIIDAKTRGFRIRYYPLDNVSDRFFLFMPQFFDVKELEFMGTILTSTSTFIDIGANSGLYSLFASQYIKTGRIIAFEPHPLMFKRLRYNVGLNHLSDLIMMKNYGVADRNKLFNLSVNPRNLGGNSITLTNQDKSDYLQETIEVPCRKLLDVLNEEKIEKIDLLKIDIEEAEHLALVPFLQQSPKRLLPKHIIIESDDRVDLGSYGYVKRCSTKSHNSIYTLKPYG